MPRSCARPDPAFYTSKVKNPSTEGQRPGPTRRSSPQRAQKGVLAPGGRRHPPMAAKLSILSAVTATVLAVAAAPAPAVANTPPATPTPLSPAAGASVDSVPPFAWSPVAAADHYEFQIAADAGFNSPVLGSGSDDFTTQNTRATVLKTTPKGTYYWRVRSVGKDGSVSPWAAGRQFRKAWTAAATLHAPARGAGLSSRTDPP